MPRFFLALAALLSLVPVSLVGAAELRLATVFSDHMVLQRDKPVPIWGWADAGQKVTVQFAGQSGVATADDRGRWSVTLQPLTASAEPRTLSVAAANVDRVLQVADVLVGEVWLGSGQSNMAMTVNRARQFETEQAAAKHPQIRMFKESSTAMSDPQQDARGSWAVCSPETVATFSATLYFFGRELHQELDVPIGLINSSVGGTPIESWISAEAQADAPQLQASYQKAAEAFAAFDEEAARAQYEKALARWQERAAAARRAEKPIPRRPQDPRGARQRRGGPGGLFNGKIAPLIPFAIRGIVWYQGEANSRDEIAQLYQYQLPALVNDWRTRWNEPLPFAWVQLPNFGREGEGWMVVREAMLKSLRLPHTGMAITVDIGETKDIHPKSKQDVGRRLAFWALGDVYGRKDVVTSGPIPDGHRMKDGKIVIEFKHAGKGLVAKGDVLEGFEILSQDGQWLPATARIDDHYVVVTHADVKQPAAVRYAWAADPPVSLFNEAGLPASPFRLETK